VLGGFPGRSPTRSSPAMLRETRHPTADRATANDIDPNREDWIPPSTAAGFG